VSESTSQSSAGISRRSLLGAFGLGAGAAAVVGAGGAAAYAATHPQPEDRQGLRYPFYGEHQQGITTPMQDYMHFAALDLTTESREALIALLVRWTQAAATMTTGAPIGTAASGAYDAPPQDTGEALDLPAAGLTITIGFGPSLFRTKDGVDRFGLADKQPAGFEDLPRFPGDDPNPVFDGGDLCIQACANDAQVAVHAVRNLVRLAFGTAAVRWAQMGFGKSSVTAKGEPTPRNLFGFKDGTANITSDDQSGLDTFVWVDSGWMSGGTYLAVRKIRMTIETWDRTSLREQEAVFGRTKGEGAPLSGGTEFSDPDFALLGRGDLPLIDPNSHVALAHPSVNGGARVLRRAYNYTDGTDALGRLDAGLFYLAFERDLQEQFVPIQMRLSQSDLMNEYVKYIGTAAFAIPPGVVAPGDYIGQSLLA